MTSETGNDVASAFWNCVVCPVVFIPNVPDITIDTAGLSMRGRHEGSLGDYGGGYDPGEVLSPRAALGEKLQPRTNISTEKRARLRLPQEAYTIFNGEC